MSDKEQNRKEEVDLGLLFSLFSSVFKRVYRFFEMLFKKLFHLIILTLLFIKKHLIKMLVVMLVGFLVGFFLEKDKQQRFQDEMLVQANYGSVRQLYKNIQYYQNLVAHKDTNKLASIFKVSPEQANLFRAFRISPDVGMESLLNSYEAFKLNLDSVVALDYTLEMYKEQLTVFDYSYHKIQIESDDARIFSKLSAPIKSAIEQDEKFVNFKKLNIERLSSKKQFLKESLAAADSLRAVYHEILLENKRLRVSQEGTVINLAKADQNSNELELFQTEADIYLQLEELQQEQLDSSVEVIRVISDFQNVGNELTDFTRKAYLRYPFIGLILLLIVISLSSLNSYLNNYSKS